jgi:PAS domain S-box-containing protein
MKIRSISITRLVVAICTVVITLLSVGIGALNYWWNARSARAAFQNDIEWTAEQFADGATLPLWNLDAAQISRNMRTLMKDPAVVGIEIISPSFTLRYARGAGGEIVADGAIPHSRSMRSFSRPLRYSGQEMGTMNLHFTTRYIEAELAQIRKLTIAVIIGFDLILILTLVFLLKKTVIHPLSRIESYATQLSSPRLPTTYASVDTGRFYGELAKLGDAISRMVEELDRSRKLLTSALNNAFGFFGLLTPEGMIYFANRKALDAAGVKAEEVVGRFYPDTKWWKHSQEARDRLCDNIRRCAAGETIAYETSMATGSGTPMDIDFSLSPLRNADGTIIFLIAEGRDITARKTAEEALRNEKAFSDTVINSLPGAFFMFEQNGRIVRWNDEYARLTGITSENASSYLLLGHIAPHDRERTGAAVRRVFAEGQADVEAELLTTNGSLPFHFYARRLQMGNQTYLVGTGYDITERRRAEQMARESEERFRMLIEVAPEAIFVQGEGRFLYLNPSMLKLLGASSTEQLIGQDLWARIAPEYHDAIRARIRMQRETGQAAPLMEQEYVRLDGRRVPVETTAIAIRYQGNDAHLVFVRDITGRRQAEQALRESQLLLEAQLKNSPDLIMTIDRDLRFLSMNKVLYHKKGMIEDFIGKDCIEPLPPQARELVRGKIAKCFETGEPQFFDHPAPSGTWAQARVVPMPSGNQLSRVMIISTDITQQKKAENELKASEERFRTLIEKAPMAIVFVQGQKVIYANASFLAMFGHSSFDEINEQNVMEKFAPQCRPQIAEYVRLRAEGKPVPSIYESIGVRKDGTQFPAQVAVARTAIGNDVVSLGFITDLTQQKENETREQRHQKELIQAEKMASLGVLVSGMAHEINNPNNLIMLNADVISRIWQDIRPVLELRAAADPDFTLDGLPFGEVQAEADRLLRGIRDSSCRIQRIVHHLKDYARSDPGQLDQRLAVNDLVEAARLIVEPLLKKSTNTFSTAFAPNLPLVLGNAQQLEQVLINLLTNACHALANPHQGIRVETRLAESGNEVQVLVRDEGAGIPSSDLSRLTDPFFTTKRDRGGTGLGLSVSAGIVKAHRGEMTFASEPGHGTTVTVALPVAMT